MKKVILLVIIAIMSASAGFFIHRSYYMQPCKDEPVSCKDAIEDQSPYVWLKEDDKLVLYYVTERLNWIGSTPIAEHKNEYEDTGFFIAVNHAPAQYQFLLIDPDYRMQYSNFLNELKDTAERKEARLRDFYNGYDTRVDPYYIYYRWEEIKE